MQQQKTGNTGFIIALIVVSLVSVAAGYGFYSLSRDSAAPDPVATASQAGGLPAIDSQLIGTPRPDFTLPDLEGRDRAIGEWDGQIVLVNFWATWCPPCRKEMPAFMELREQYNAQGFEIVGVAIDDPQQVQDFIDTLGVNYPVLHGDVDAMEIAKAYGDRFVTLPYSVLLDREGRIRFIQPGELHKEVLEAQIQALL
ncbi:MAG: TlpA family protein disulfide reductase [Gammaproteobacteria bacterium]|nr:TlpA family protein disulfide reductase [Gammaproteobacteria bacterium]